jgi:NAD(P)-dependent dehydrogenase (short-subunit alcohol dehydrogenase family)
MANVAVVAGAGSGIGRATALLLAEQGFHTVAVDIDERAATETATLIAASGHAASAHAADVSDVHAVRLIIDSVNTELGDISALINSAGILRVADLAATTDDDWDRTMEVNARSCFLLARAALPSLLASKGAIVNIASTSGLRPGLRTTAYAASKGAIIAFSRALAMEVAPNVRVNSVCPGWVDTGFNAPSIQAMGGDAALEARISRLVPMRRQAESSEIAQLVAFLATDRASFITGQCLVIDGGEI